MSPGRLLSWVCLVPSPVVGPVPGAGRAKILRHICVRPGFGKRVGRWRVSGSRLRVVPPSFSTGVSRVTLVSFSLRFRFSRVTKVVDLQCPFLQGLLELVKVVLRLLEYGLVYLQFLWCGRERWLVELTLDFGDFGH